MKKDLCDLKSKYLYKWWVKILILDFQKFNIYASILMVITKIIKTGYLFTRS